MDYFISDIHFGHKNIIRFCDRPFNTVSEMNREIIKKWNAVVTDSDRVFVVGDVFLCPAQEAKLYMQELKGYKILIKGNHDLSKPEMISAGFDEYHRSLDYTMPDGRTALLKHYPSPDCLLDQYDLMIHGHIHISERVRGKKINVSCDIWEFTPISVEELNKLDTSSGANNDSEFVKVTVSEDKMLTIHTTISMLDFSGFIDHVYKQMDGKWPRSRK
jgi:calcineurin-like phosphoesterase family protein